MSKVEMFRASGLDYHCWCILISFVPSCRIESYSCKMAGDDKHMFKQFCQEGEPHVLEALSPPQSSSAASPSLWVTPGWWSTTPFMTKPVKFPFFFLFLRLGKSSEDGENPLSDKCCRKTLFYLITTLNESFRPDYDFSAARAHEFSRESSLNWVSVRSPAWPGPNVSMSSSSGCAEEDLCVSVRLFHRWLTLWTAACSQQWGRNSTLWGQNCGMPSTKRSTCRAVTFTGSVCIYFSPGQLLWWQAEPIKPCPVDAGL